MQLFPRWPDEHVAHEECMICSSTNNPHTDAVPLIPASIAINNIDSVACIQVVNSPFSVDPPYLKLNGQKSGSRHT